MKLYLKLTLLLILLTGLMVACSPTTQLRKSSSEDSMSEGPIEPFEKVFIMITAKTAENRKVAEDKLVSLIKNGVAVPSYTYIGPADSSQKILVDRLIKDGFDGAITMRVKAVVQTKTKTKASASHGTAYEGWYSPYGYGYSYTYNIDASDKSTPNVDVSGDKDYIVESNIYSLKTKKLLWSGVTASMSARKVDGAMTGIVNTVKKELKKKGFIKD
jgi:hypothetical protein